MSVLTAIQNAAPVIGLPVPDQVYGAGSRQAIELGALANEMARRIAEEADWQKLLRLATYTGDGSTEDFDFPDDYDRLILDCRLYPSTTGWALTHIDDIDTWLAAEVQNEAFINNAWTIFGNQIHVKPPLPSGQTVKHWYVTTNIVRSVQGDAKAAFTADEDVFVLDERLLKLAIIWQWRANKGLAYAEDLTNYEDLKGQLIGKDKGRSSIAVGRPTWPADVQAPYPWGLG